ncbi:hypothetical protein [Companilactobacillus jidongensis]|uniref:hypothetical protein n=1 Tax=Companilactobacillus jidongensis TaxID=2486006 RepID=UPI000F79AB65|nr:hypothetical protein [Companilactobacillus jidongensis]
MTSFGNVFKAMFKEKFRNMNFFLMINVIAIVVSIIVTAFQGGMDKSTPLAITIGWSMLAGVISFVMLSVIQERKYTRDSYRLIPVSDTKFYLANLATSFVSYLYVIVAQAVFYLIAAIPNWSEYSDTLNMMAMMNGRASFDAPNAIMGVLAMTCLMLVILILSWTTINLIHLASRSASNFLPSTGRRVMNVVIYVVVIWLVLRVVGFVMNQLNNSVNMLFNSNYTANFALTIVVFLVVAVAEAAVSIYLMNNWVETISE